VSLFFYRRRILKAIAGDLPMESEHELRKHLQTCNACRTFYDRVGLVAEALPGVDAKARRREREGLLFALSRRTVLHPAQPSRRRRWPILMAPALGVASLAIWLSRSHEFSVQGGRQEQETIQWRGNDVPAQTTPIRLLVHAKRKVSPQGAPSSVRLIAELPGSGEAHVSLQEFVQFSYRDLQVSSYFTLVGLLANGDVHAMLPINGSPSVRLEPVTRTTAIGPSLDLDGRVPPGPLQVLAIVSTEAIGAEQVRETIAAWKKNSALPKSVALLSGLLIVER